MAIPSPPFSLSKHSLSNSPSFHASNPSLDPSKASALGAQNVNFSSFSLCMDIKMLYLFSFFLLVYLFIAYLVAGLWF
jgi:hypothetical protein